MASMAASDTSTGPSSSGKPCPRLMAPVAAASADISAKIVVPSPASRDDSTGRLTISSALHAPLPRSAGAALEADGVGGAGRVDAQAPEAGGGGEGHAGVGGDVGGG